MMWPSRECVSTAGRPARLSSRRVQSLFQLSHGKSGQCLFCRNRKCGDRDRRWVLTNVQADFVLTHIEAAFVAKEKRSRTLLRQAPQIRRVLDDGIVLDELTPPYDSALHRTEGHKIIDARKSGRKAASRRYRRKVR